MENPDFQTVGEFLDQDEFWVNKDGWMRISDMNTTFRRRAAAMLLRRARFFTIWQLDEDTTDNSDHYVQEFIGRVAAPTNFMRRTRLYKRMIEGGADPTADWQDDE